MHSGRWSWRSPALGPRRSLVLPQAEIGYHDIGAGPAVVLVHGAMVNSNLWRKVVPVLARTARCITLDLPFGAHLEAMPPGSDLSPPAMAELIADAIAALRLDEVTLVGNDNGGAYCQLVVTRRPERVARLVLTSSDALDCFPAAPLRPLLRSVPILARAPGLLWPLLLPLRVSALRRWLVRAIRIAKYPIEPKALDSYALPALTDSRVRRDILSWGGGFDAQYTLQAAETLPRFKGPTLIAWSEEDRFFPRQIAERLANIVPRARLEWIADSYTFSPEDQPGHLSALINEFVETA